MMRCEVVMADGSAIIVKGSSAEDMTKAFARALKHGELITVSPRMGINPYNILYVRDADENQDQS